MAADPQLQIGMGLVEQVLLLMRKQYGLDIMREEMTFRPALGAVMRELLGDAPPPPQPDSNLRPFSVVNNQILKDGRLWKGLGMNFRELPFYGLGLEPVRWATDTHFFQQLDGAVSKKAKVIRVYCAHPALSVEQAILRVRRVLDEAQRRGLYVTLCISDAAPEGSFFVADTPANKQGRYTWAFIQGGYQGYLRYVDALTKAIGDHDAVFSIEPFNELTAPTYPLSDTQSESMLDFWRQITNLIRANAPTKLISNGNVSSWELWVLDAYNNGKYALKMAQLPNLDLLCFHSYPVTSDVLGAAGQHIRNEVNLIKSNNVGKVAFILEETAARWEPVETSAEPVQKQVDALFAMGFAAAFLWGVSFPYGQDIGVHGAGYPNWNNPPLSTRWHNTINGWFPAIATDLERVLGS